MEKRSSEAGREQPDLFRPTPTRPEWRALPEQVRRRTVALLAQLMREGAAARRPESGDE